MAIVSSYIFWVIVAAIIIVLALIGYLAEGTEFANKALHKKNGDLEQTDTGVVKADLPVEVLKVQENPSAWTGDVPIASERQEMIHKVDSTDDWMNVPNVKDAPKVTTEDVQKAMDDNKDFSNSAQNNNENVSDVDDANSQENQDIFDDSQEFFPDIKPEDLEPMKSASTDNQDVDTVWK